MAAESSRSKGGDDVEALLKKLKLSEGEKTGVFLAKEARGNLPEVKWMAVARVLTRKGFSDESLRRTMLAAWNPAREVSFSAIGRNLYIVQATCLGDWKRIMEEGPWLFRDCALMLEKYDGASTNPPVPYRVLAWTQIHKVPPLFLTEDILTQLAGKIGKVDMVESKAVATVGGEFNRARVYLAAEEPLMRFVTLSPEGWESMIFQVKFEKLPKFCEYCGLMGHGTLECGSGEYTDEQLQFGDWMLAPMESWHSLTPRVRGGARPERDDARAGRGREQAGRGDRTPRGGRHTGNGYGRGMYGPPGGRGEHPVWREKEGQNSGSRKRNSGEAMLEGADELKDTATGPLKPIEESSDKGVGSALQPKQLTWEDTTKGKDGQIVAAVPPPPPTYVSPKEAKRQKKNVKGKDDNKPLAGSGEECRRDK